MTGFFGRIFGGKKKATSPISSLLEETITTLIEKANFDLKFELSFDESEEGEPQALVEFSGPDEDLLKDKEGQMIDALQLYFKRVVQHRFPEDRSNIVIDCGGFREESNQALVELAEKLKGIALEKGKSVYVRPLAPRDRKIVHQYLATDERVRSRSIGDGLFKKIKIYPSKSVAAEEKAEH